MNTSKIVSVRDTGQTWNDFHKLEVELEDGVKGVANAKSTDPWYHEAGTEVLYESKENQYGVMLKIKKPDGAPPSAGQKGFHAGMSKAGHDNRVNDIRMGRCWNNAVLFAINAEGGANYDLTELKKHALEMYDAEVAMAQFIEERDK